MAVSVILLTGCSSAAGKNDKNDIIKPSASSSMSSDQQNSHYHVSDLVGIAVDYSDEDNWAHLPEETTYPVDTFFIYPTVYSDASEGAPALASIDNEMMREGVAINYERAPAVFEEDTNIYEPYYRQTNLAVIAKLSSKEFFEYQYQEQRTDIYAALDYYFEHFNQGRPFILAGHSQGAVMVKIALIDYFREHEEYLDRMVAAYALGFSITKDDLKTNPKLKFAERADDTGVIVSWNTEGAGNKNKDNFVVMKNSIAINPINWKRDGTPASVEENLGSRSFITDDTGEVICKDERPGLLDAQVDIRRGVVVCTTMTDRYVSVTLFGDDFRNPFGPASLHQMDYLGYWDNIKENVKCRIERYMEDL